MFLYATFLLFVFATQNCNADLPSVIPITGKKMAIEMTIYREHCSERLDGMPTLFDFFARFVEIGNGLEGFDRPVTGSAYGTLNIRNQQLVLQRITDKDYWNDKRFEKDLPKQIFMISNQSKGPKHWHAKATGIIENAILREALEMSNEDAIASVTLKLEFK